MLTELVAGYVSARDRFVARIAVISAELNTWTEHHQETPPTLADLARFEGLRAERSSLLAEFQEFEDRFVVEMLQALSATHQRS